MLISYKADRTVSISDTNTIVTTTKSDFFQEGLIENSLILINKLIVTVNGSSLIDKQNRVIRQIMSIGEFYTVKEHTKTCRMSRRSPEGNKRQVRLGSYFQRQWPL